MTIAAGFVCRDGIVLFTDTEEQQGYIKTKEEKIRKFETGGRSFVIANAGNGYLADSLVDYLFDAVSAAPKEQDVIPAIRKTLIRFHKEEVALYPSENALKSVGLIMGLHLPGNEPILLHSDATALRKVQEFVVIGYGAEIKFIAQQLYAREMPLKRGILIANHLAKTARLYIQNCGGETRIATLANHKIEVQHRFDVWGDEQLFSSLERVYRAVLLSMPDEEISDDDFDNCLGWFVDEAWRHRTEMLDTREFNKEIKKKAAESKGVRGIEKYYQPPPDLSQWGWNDRRKKLKRNKQDNFTSLSKLSGAGKSEPEP